MTRFFIKPIVLLLGLFTLTLIGVHAQPYDDAGLHAFLVADGCPSPCFMGIRPGVTTADEAIAALKANPWVKHLSVNVDQ